MKLIKYPILFVLAMICLSSAYAQDSDSWENLKIKCARCHPIGKTFKKEYDRQKWITVVDKMRAKNPEWIKEDEAISIASILGDISDFRQGLAPQTDYSSTPNTTGSSDSDFSIIHILGLTAFTLLISTIGIGLVVRRKYKKLLPIHRLFALITFIAAIFHIAAVVLRIY